MRNHVEEPVPVEAAEYRALVAERDRLREALERVAALPPQATIGEAKNLVLIALDARRKLDPHGKPTLLDATRVLHDAVIPPRQILAFLASRSYRYDEPGGPQRVYSDAVRRARRETPARPDEA